MFNRVENFLKEQRFPVFFISTVFIITCSNNAITDWAFPWNQSLIVVACLLPVFLVIINKARLWLCGKEIFPEMYYIPAIIFLGVLNVMYGEQLLRNFKGMGLFLLSGISVFAAAIFILKSHKARTILFWLYTAIIVVLAVNSIYAQLWYGHYNPLFSNNPIPESALITLLLTGPIMLFQHQKNSKVQGILASCFLLGLATILILNQRAAVFALLIVIFMLGFFFINRFWIYFSCISMLIVLSLWTAYEFYEELPENTQQTLRKLANKPLYRMEMLFFAHHIIKKKPLFGTGLWTPLDNHLEDYNEKFFTPPYQEIEINVNQEGASGRSLLTERVFYNFVRAEIFGNTSFHNFLVCMFVQMGGAFSVLYLALLFLIFSKAFNSHKKNPKALFKLKLLMIPLTGFFIQSMAFDSLMYPDINFVFHSILGILAGDNWAAREEPQS